jgi:hypothetical protein
MPQAGITEKREGEREELCTNMAPKLLVHKSEQYIQGLGKRGRRRDFEGSNSVLPIVEMLPTLHVLGSFITLRSFDW